MLLYAPTSQPLPRGFAIAPRPARLDGLRIGFLDNTKAPVDKIMDYLEVKLREQIPGAQIYRTSKKHPSLPAEAEVMQALAANADVVINALGD